MATHNKHRKVSNIFANEVASVREGSKGRSSRLIEKRNRAMCNRYYYHQKINSCHYAKCVEELSTEFFISQIEVTKILRNMAEYLNELRTQPPTIKQLRERWSFMCWE